MNTVPDTGSGALALRPEDAAQRLGVAKSTILEWVRLGVIPADCVLRLGANGHTVRLHAERLREWIDGLGASGYSGPAARPSKRLRPLRTAVGR